MKVIAEEHRTIYTPFAAEALGSQSQGDPTRLWKANKQDPWDGRDSREASASWRPCVTRSRGCASTSCRVVFKKHGAFGGSYFSPIATGENNYYTHYNRNTAILADGDLVQFDYAPDFRYYQSDVTRVFPANGVFTARQRETYEIYPRLYRAVMTSIKAHITTAEVIKAAVVKMDAIMESFPFTDPRIQNAARAFVEDYRRRSAAAPSE